LIITGNFVTKQPTDISACKCDNNLFKDVNLSSAGMRSSMPELFQESQVTVSCAIYNLCCVFILFQFL